MLFSSFFYDKQDKYFLSRINRIIKHSRVNDHRSLPPMHPNGIIDLTTAQELRMASAVLSLLDTLQTRNAPERLHALENLHNEVLLTTRTKFRRNTARVLIEVMKEIVRAYGNEDLQLKLVHDFRMAAQGKQTIVRKLLKKYYLLEMPELWNQLVFDHHVHDASTKGRKSPTHLIMDAWVKGIRSLTVIYYNYVSPEAGKELVCAAEIMGIKVRIGILFNTVFRHKLIDFIWVPRGFSDVNAFISFLTEPPMQQLAKEGMEVSKWKEKFTLNIIDEWNSTLRQQVEQEFKIAIEPIEKATFFEFVGLGQSSVLHLSELIHKISMPKLKERANFLNKEIKKAADEKQKTLLMNDLKSIDMLTPEYFLEILEDCENIQEKHIVAEIINADENSDVPKILQEKTTQLIQRLYALSSGNRIILNLSRSTPEEVLNLLWDCRGLISHLEIFNVYDWHNGNSPYTLEINDIMQSINTSNTPNLKQIIQSLIHACEKEEEQSFFNFYTNHAKHKTILSETKQLTILESASKVKDMDTETDATYLYHDSELFVDPPKPMQQTTSVQVTIPEESDSFYTQSNEDNIEEDIIIHETKKIIDAEKKAEENAETISKELENSLPPHKSNSKNPTSSPAYLEKFKNDPRFQLISRQERIEKLRSMLRNMLTLINYYKRKKLFTRMGTDSTSRTGRLAGMGLAYAETLPQRAIKELRTSINPSRLRLPVRKEIEKIITYHMPYANEKITTFTKILRCIPILKHFTFHKTTTWDDKDAYTTVFDAGECSSDLSSFPTKRGNIITLGGVGIRTTNQFRTDTGKKDNVYHTTRVNTNLLNVLKLLIGFIPAFISFQYTQEIPFLAWFGALIWFLITGFRNIIQAVLGGGGLQRSPLLRWNNYVSWSRFCDSLMYTGISVVLLELIVRNYILQNTFNITSLTAPLLTFSVISILNGGYIVFHNIIRGLQTEAIVGNFFRSFFSIPIALIYNNIFTAILLTSNIQNLDVILLSSSAILSKVASDTVAAIIEGLADKRSNIWFRRWDYKMATQKMYANYSKLELAFPEKSVLNMLNDPQKTLDLLKEQNPNLYTSIILNALDFMYFYYYQPRALSTLKDIIHNLSDMERLSWLRVQYVLKCQKDISQLFVDGVVSENFSRALSFYLDKHEQYIKELEVLYQTRIEQGKQ